MLKIKLIISLLSLSTFISFAQEADAIIGKYHLPNNLDVEISKNNGKYHGKIIALNGYANGQKEDTNNPDPSECNTPLLGKTIIEDLKYDQKKMEWTNGSMYSPEKGMLFDLKVKKVTENGIVVVGSKFIIWKTLEWAKLK